MSNKTLRSVVRGVGAFLPERIMTNDELAKKVDTSDEWIQQRTGIRQRHIAAPGETTAGLAVKAAEAALADAGLTPGDIDLIIVGTSTPDYTFPAVATQVQASLGIHHGVAFDLQAVCSGFVFAVTTADKFLTSGSHKRALVIGGRGKMGGWFSDFLASQGFQVTIADPRGGLPGFDQLADCQHGVVHLAFGMENRTAAVG